MARHRKLKVGDYIFPSTNPSVRLRVQGIWQEGSDIKYRAMTTEEPHSIWFGYATLGGKDQVVVIPWASEM